jgi:hypothetical protein
LIALAVTRQFARHVGIPGGKCLFDALARFHHTRLSWQKLPLRFGCQRFSSVAVGKK